MSNRRAERRRRRRGEPAPTPPSGGLRLGRTERIGLIFLGIGVVAVLIMAVAFLALTSGGDDSTNTAANQATNTAAPSGTPGATPDAADAQALSALARKSIEVLPQGQWPSLYSDFTPDFQARCTLAEFTQAGVDTETNLGTALQQLEFNDFKDATVSGDTATGTIVGDYKNQAGSDYDIEAVFARVAGVWKIAPAPNTTGCQAFNVISQDTPAS